MCSDTRFAEQPALAECSGVLLSPTQVLTAGHCFPAESSCSSMSIVFDYRIDAADGAVHVSREAVYSCKRLLALHRTISLNVPPLDYAVVELDRVAMDRQPVRLADGLPTDGTQLHVIGHPSGLPSKLDTGASVYRVSDPARMLFWADSDTFGASSGSGAFDADGRLLGILIGGGSPDYALGDAGCNEVHAVRSADDVPEPEQYLGMPALTMSLCGDGLGPVGCTPSQSGRSDGADASIGDADHDTPSGGTCAVAAPGSLSLNHALLGALLGVLSYLSGRQRKQHERARRRGCSTA